MTLLAPFPLPFKASVGNKAHFWLFAFLLVAAALLLQDWTGGFAADRGDHADDRYMLKFQTPAEVAGWIDEVGIGWIVLDEDSRYRDFPHNALLKSAIDQGLLHATLKEVVDHDGGRMSLYALPQASNVVAISGILSAALYPGHIDKRN